MPVNLWEQEKAAPLTGIEELVYRSNLLGQDRSVANWGGGNTSMKTVEWDFMGQEVAVMWVKGSGADLATMKSEHFTALRLDDVLPLFERDEMEDEEMVAYLRHCMMDSQHPRMSIETLLHAFLPFNHVDHTHPDAIVSICCTEDGEAIAREIYGDRFVWVPYIRPGFQLSKIIGEKVRANPQAELVLMEKHGLVTWGETSEQCYQSTMKVIQAAEDYIETRVKSVGEQLFNGEKAKPLNTDERKAILTAILPLIRGRVSREKRMIVSVDDSDAVMNFVNSVDAPRLSQVGAACPDHLVHTKRLPLYVDWDPAEHDTRELKRRMEEGINRYESDYRNYFERNQQDGDAMFEPVPRVILIPGIGMVTTGKSKKMADISRQLYQRAIAVMKGSSVLGSFVSLNEKESFDVEYWPLELYKLSLAPPEAEFSRQVAFITGGAGGIGGATARKLVQQGAHVVLADLNQEGAAQLAHELNEQTGEKRAVSIGMDVTDEGMVKAAYGEAVNHFGGIDILVNNAGLATSSPLEETSLDEWNRNLNVLTTGYFLVAREAFALMKTQRLGGNMVFIGSKNSVYAGKNAAAYSTAKAAEAHLARCIAAEGGPYGIRVNTVLPDAVLSGSAIWTSRWREERAAAYGIEPDQLEEYYRKRTLLQVNVYPDDIAETVLYLASSKAAKTTGCMITVDGGVPAAFTR
ncbi:bifunctional aldolase/short-chain dehydrogenase [Desmospora activa]|uniref:Rhamnulose-1-phosphate aldolase/alcohol dehydrogenase n=1 Tax=Desmospora activa DSM 45169 TaxID=1121389 RepID=A0A2T4Z0P2_9BACL|nr:bifunctional aldolase/short-chain dehydrogenase [Desmospora activa]PTM53292.1 rhamnulose-1-phosphate aldolase/alcohol dehydrogenase [Desmospora activa DSM 45169]